MMLSVIKFRSDKTDPGDNVTVTSISLDLSLMAKTGKVKLYQMYFYNRLKFKENN